MAGCLFVVFALGMVGCLLAVPFSVPDLMARQTPAEHPSVAEWFVLYGVSVLTALLVAWSSGRRRPGARLLLAVRTAVLLGLSTVVVLWTRGQVESDNWTLESTAVNLTAGTTALLFRVAVRRWERGRPLPGEVWLALVPFRERDEAAQHYCVVVARRLGYAQVLQITSQNKDDRDDHVFLPNDGWDLVSGKPHWLEIGLPPRKVPYRDFLKDRPQGPCPKAAWRQVRTPVPDFQPP